jgi:hypothetical protein
MRAVAAGLVEYTAGKPQPGGPLDDVRAVLLRPDGHVAWAGTDLTHLTTSLFQWFGKQGGR